MLFATHAIGGCSFQTDRQEVRSFVQHFPLVLTSLSEVPGAFTYRHTTLYAPHTTLKTRYTNFNRPEGNLAASAQAILFCQDLNWLQVDIFRCFFVKLKNILYIPLSGSATFTKVLNWNQLPLKINNSTARTSRPRHLT